MLLLRTTLRLQTSRLTVDYAVQILMVSQLK